MEVKERDKERERGPSLKGSIPWRGRRRERSWCPHARRRAASEGTAAPSSPTAGHGCVCRPLLLSRRTSVRKAESWAAGHTEHLRRGRPERGSWSLTSPRPAGRADRGAPPAYSPGPSGSATAEGEKGVAVGEMEMEEGEGRWLRIGVGDGGGGGGCGGASGEERRGCGVSG